MFYLAAGSKPIAQSAKGIYITADDGKSYMDAASGAIVCQLGHSHPKIIEAIKKQVLELQFSYRTQFENQPAIDLANMIVEKTNHELDRVFFVSGGSEAVESAMKLIRQYHFANGDESRSVFISRVPSYHGCTMGVLALTGYEPLNRPFTPMFQLYPKVKSPTQYRIPDGMTQEEYGLFCANEVETAILETGTENVAGFVAEPIGGASSGAEVPHDIYFPRVQEICKQYNVPIILDEVMTGIGRTGKMFGYNHWNIDADVICLAKGLGAGYYPVAAIVAKDKFVQPVMESGGFMHGFTYGGNPFGCAVGCAVLKTIEEENLVENSRIQGEYLLAEIKTRAENYDWIGDVRGRGLLMAIEYANKKTKDPFPDEWQVGEAITQAAYDLGLIIYPKKSHDGTTGDHTLITPPLIITREESDKLLDLLDQTFEFYDKVIKNK
jgi:adenosylmethionine-8-amino-7-oxononanoate aminotransferase